MLRPAFFKLASAVALIVLLAFTMVEGRDSARAQIRQEQPKLRSKA